MIVFLFKNTLNKEIKNLEIQLDDVLLLNCL